MTSTIERRPSPTVASGDDRPSDRSRRIAQLRVRGFRSVVDARLAPGRMCALVGEAQVGKSNLLAAVNALLDESAYLAPTDATTLAETPIQIEATLETGERLAWELYARKTPRFLPHLERPPSPAVPDKR